MQPNDKKANAVSAGFNGAVGSPGLGAALKNLAGLFGGSAPSPTPQLQAQEQVAPNDMDEKAAKLKALQSIMTGK